MAIHAPILPLFFNITIVIMLLTSLLCLITKYVYSFLVHIEAQEILPYIIKNNK
jgi:hypothetical protein